jgi:hypothetical protein
MLTPERCDGGTVGDRSARRTFIFQRRFLDTGEVNAHRRTHQLLPAYELRPLGKSFSS